MASSYLITTHGSSSRRPLGEKQDDTDGRPDGDQRGEDPEQKRGLADRQPRQLLAREEEPSAAGRPPVRGELDDLAGDRRGGIVGRTPVGVDENDPPVAPLVAHVDTVPRFRAGLTSATTRLRRAGLVGAVGLLGVMVGALVGGPSQASGAARSTVLLSHGDTARVADVPVGCLVVRRGVPPATMLDCRRAGPLAGTYGVLLGRWNVRVVRFRSAREAQVVFTATHGGRSVCCTGSRP